MTLYDEANKSRDKFVKYVQPITRTLTNTGLAWLCPGIQCVQKKLHKPCTQFPFSKHASKNVRESKAQRRTEL